VLRIAAALAIAAASFAGQAARDAEGALPPNAYLKLQAEAPEAIEIRILSVDARRSQRQGHGGRDYVHQDIVAMARVERVLRSASGLKPGDTVRIAYAIGEPIAGPGYPRELQTEGRYMAYVECRAIVPGVRTCTPSAYAHTFEPVTEPVR